MDFIPSRADQCIWLKKNEKLNIYEYIAVYVDDLCIAAKDPKEIINVLKSKYHLKVKGDGQLTYHLGADYFQDPDGTMVSHPKKYIEKLKETYIRLFNTEPSKGLKTPLEKNDHPELDTSEILEGQEVNHYLTTVGQLQWLITLGRFDIQAQVITMSRVRAQPRKGHLDRLKRIYAYGTRTKDMQPGLEQQNLIILTYLIKILIGLILFMVMYRILYQMTFQILWVNLSQPLLQWMQT